MTQHPEDRKCDSRKVMKNNVGLFCRAQEGEVGVYILEDTERLAEHLC